jgi:membrane-associated protease RseP (regulator of RpoE activity)
MVLARYSLIAFVLTGAVVSNGASQVPSASTSRGGYPPPPRPSSGPRALLWGFAVDCRRCSLAPGNDDPAPVWHYSEPPRVAAVRRNGAADLAGVQEGDTILAIDGLSILSADGARRFSRVRPGDRVRLTLHRDGRPFDATLQLGRPPEVPPPVPASTKQPPRYSGEVGGAAVDVWSASPVAVSVDSTGALVIQTGTSTIRVAPPAVPARRGYVKLTPF